MRFSGTRLCRDRPELHPPVLLRGPVEVRSAVTPPKRAARRGRSVAMVDTQGASTVLRCQLGDHLGAAQWELDESGKTLSYEEFHPYGSTAVKSVRSGEEVSRKRYRYAGMGRDEETGLQYHTARNYAAWLGRWCSAEPVGLKAGVNVCAYVAGRPTSRLDDTGRGSVVPVQSQDIRDYKTEVNKEDTVPVPSSEEVQRLNILFTAFSGGAFGGFNVVVENGGGAVFLSRVVDPELSKHQMSCEGQECFPGGSDTIAVMKSSSWVQERMRDGGDTRVVIFGYSRGGDLATRTAATLDEAGIPVATRCPVDPTEGPLNYVGTTLGGTGTVSGNGASAVIVYQADDVLLSGEDVSRRMRTGSPLTELPFVQMSGHETNMPLQAHGSVLGNALEFIGTNFEAKVEGWSFDDGLWPEGQCMRDEATDDP